MSTTTEQKQEQQKPPLTEGEKLVAEHGLGKLHTPGWGYPVLMVEASTQGKAEKIAWKNRTKEYLPDKFEQVPYKQGKIYKVTYKPNKVEKETPLKPRGVTIQMHRDVVGLLKPLVPLMEVEVTFSGKGLALKRMDPSHILLVDLQLGRRYFKSLPKKPVTITFKEAYKQAHPLEQLPKVFDLMDEVKIFKYAEVFIGTQRTRETYTDGTKKVREEGTVSIAGIEVADLSDATKSIVPLPKLKGLSRSTLKVKELKQILDKADKAGFETITFFKKGAKFIGRFRPGTLQIPLNKAATTPSRKVESGFNIPMLKNMLVPAWGEKAELWLSKKLPLKLRYKLKGGSVDCYLAPKVEENKR